MTGNSAGCDRRRHRVVGDATRSLTSRSSTNKRPSEIRPSFMLPLTGSAFLGVKRSWSRPWGRTVRGLTWGNRMGQISAPHDTIILRPVAISDSREDYLSSISEARSGSLSGTLSGSFGQPVSTDVISTRHYEIFLNGWGFVEPPVGEAHGPCLGISSFLVSTV